MIDQLKNKVLKMYGAPINTSKDCEILSQDILSKTNRSISPSTLRRFFGLLPSKSSISKFNLDTLSQYCDADDYINFTSSNAHDTISNKHLNEKINRLNTYTLESIRRKCLSKFDHTIERHTINDYINYFQNSKYTFLPVVASGGSGKSIALAHWVEKFANEGCIFISAELLYQHIYNPNTANTDLNFDLDAPKNLYQQILRTASVFIIIDEFEEISNSANKIKLLTSHIEQLINRYSASGKLKIVLNLRESSWENIVKHLILERKAKSNRVATGLLDLPLLSNSEVKEILKKKNEKTKLPVYYSCLSWNIRDFIKFPIHLHIFTETLNTTPGKDGNSPSSIYHNYLSTLIFQARYAEQKEDITWKIIELMISSKSFSIDKNTLKHLLPIHLKRETDYYNAYKELLGIGLLYEERVPNKYRLYSTLIKVPHANLFYYLCALYLFKENQKSTTTLLWEIAKGDYSLEWKTAVIADIFNIAYQAEDFEALQSLCDLPDEILSSVPIRFNVCMSFRHRNAIWDKVVNKYVSSKSGQLYFFEHFVDTNYLFNNYEDRIIRYLNHKKTSEAQMFGHSILFLSGFLKMDKQICTKQMEILNTMKPEEGIHPYPISRHLAYTILYQGFVKGQQLNHRDRLILEYKNIAYSYTGYLNFGFIAFELAVLTALILTKNYHLIVSLFNDVYECYNLDNPKDEFFSLLANNQNSLPYFYLEYAKYKLGLEHDAGLAKKLTTFLEGFKTAYDDFQYQILLNWIVFDITHETKPQIAQEYFKNAMEISQFSQYTFYEKFLLLNNSETQENDENIAFIKEKGFKPKFLLGHLKR